MSFAKLSPIFFTHTSWKGHFPVLGEWFFLGMIQGDKTMSISNGLTRNQKQFAEELFKSHYPNMTWDEVKRASIRAGYTLGVGDVSRLHIIERIMTKKKFWDYYRSLERE
jgi:hypothetical protein